MLMLRVASVQLGDDLEVRDQGPQLRGGSEVELAAFVEIERPVKIIRLDTQGVDTGPSFVKRDAVGYAARVALRQQSFADQAEPGGFGVIGKGAQLVDDASLRRRVQG